MSYEALIEEVKTMPEQFIVPVSAFIKLLKNEQAESSVENSQNNMKDFFDLAGKIHLDPNSVTEFREASLL